MKDAEVVDRPDRWRLLDEREFLRRSLDDAAREHAAGDLADEDYELLRRRDEERLAVVESAIAERERSAPAAPAAPPLLSGQPGQPGPPEDDAADDPAEDAPDDPPAAGRSVRGRTATIPWSGRRRRRRWLALGGVGLLVAGGILLAVELAAPRLPGETPTGSIDLTQAQQEQRLLSQAQALVNGNHPAQALQLYGEVLSKDPKDPVALAEWGWLEWQAATAAKEATAATDGQAAVQRAVTLAPRLYAAEYYLGTILLDDGQATQAVADFTTFLSDHPTAKWLSDAAPTIRRAFTAADQPVPAGVPATPSASG